MKKDLHEKLSYMLIPLEEFRDQLGISVSTERRLRQQKGHGWPPRILVGRRVFYWRQGVLDWLAGQLADEDFDQSEPIPAGAGAEIAPELDESAQVLTAGRPLEAPTFTAEQISWMRAFFAHPELDALRNSMLIDTSYISGYDDAE